MCLLRVEDLIKTLPTFPTSVWLLSSVSTDVTLQMINSLGRVSTVRALVKHEISNFL